MGGQGDTSGLPCKALAIQNHNMQKTFTAVAMKKNDHKYYLVACSLNLNCPSQFEPTVVVNLLSAYYVVWFPSVSSV